VIGHLHSTLLYSYSFALVIRANDGNFYSTGSKCTHYGAPLKLGVLSDDRLVCPWHAAAFNCKTGDIEDGPVLDCLPTYPVTTSSTGELTVSVTIDKSSRRKPSFCKRDSGNGETYIVVGGGPAGGAAVETLRAEGFTGKVILINKEEWLPYDRPKLSKSMQVEMEKLQLRNKKFYVDAGVDVLLGKGVTTVDVKSRTVTLEDGSQLGYSKVLLATGTFCRSFKAPERFTIPGAELDNIFTVLFLFTGFHMHFRWFTVHFILNFGW
jgi:nitrite reductase/ring-hydroxylating ferredoxin subunit